MVVEQKKAEEIVLTCIPDAFTTTQARRGGTF